MKLAVALEMPYEKPTTIQLQYTETLFIDAYHTIRVINIKKIMFISGTTLDDRDTGVVTNVVLVTLPTTKASAKVNILS